MIIRELFKKPIDRHIEGVVTIGNENEAQKMQELEEYVCTEEITASFRTFFRRYRESITRPTENMGVWITGSFGSGKSHFLKILGYILENETVAGKESIDYFTEKIKDPMVMADMRASARTKNKVVIFNIDSKAKADSKQNNQTIMDIMLRSFNEAIGYCGGRPWVADLERTLDNEEILNDFIARFEEYSGRDWVHTRANAFLNRDYIIRALVASRNMSEESARKFVDDQSKNFTSTTEDFAKTVDEYCKKNNTRVIFLMDEVGQFIGDNSRLMLNLQTCAEDLGKFCRGQVWIAVTSQQHLKDMIDSSRDKKLDFSKIQGRFDTRLLLSGANADEVIKRRILEKKDIAIDPLKALYEANSNKLSQLIIFPDKPSLLAFRDADDFKDVYPFVPYQFGLLQKVFEAVRINGMSEGKHISQNERSMLSGFQKSAQDVADRESDLLVPFDSFYSTIDEFIDYDIKTVFTNARKNPSLDSFAIRVLRILFMIKHVKEMSATIDHLSTLMVDSINADKTELKRKISEALNSLEKGSLIQRNGEEYDFLTNEEQDVNRQISNTQFSEGEIKHTILDTIYERILDNNKYRYKGRYDFAINRYVDDEIKGNSNENNISLKIMTWFSDLREQTEFQAESLKSDSIIVDLTRGSFIDELIQANRIEAYKRNNSGPMSATLTDIMNKKTAEASERRRRAEDLIRDSLRDAAIYLRGNKLLIGKKDAKDRLEEALRAAVEQSYFKLPMVDYFYTDQKSILNVLNDDSMTLDIDELSHDDNSKAYDEILKKVNDEANLGKANSLTVKVLLDYFSRIPYGWRDLDILGMVATLWKHKKIDIFIHGTEADEKNTSFKNDLARKNNVDIMVVRVKEKIEDDLLYEVQLLMLDTFEENLPKDEAGLKEGVVSFFEEKRRFLTDLSLRFGHDYAGHETAREIYNVINDILNTGSSSLLFKEIIKKKEELHDKAGTLEQLEAFYKAGSSLKKNFDEAKEIALWYGQNNSLEDLSALKETVAKINEITHMDIPFSRMNELSDLVFKAKTEREKIFERKLEHTRETLKADNDKIDKELKALSRTYENDEAYKEKLDKIQEEALRLQAQYQTWLSLITAGTHNLDSYIIASKNALTAFKSFISDVLNENDGGHDEEPPKLKEVRIIDYVPSLNRRIKTTDAIETLLGLLHENLLNDLKDNDEILLS